MLSYANFASYILVCFTSPYNQLHLPGCNCVYSADYRADRKQWSCYSHTVNVFEESGNRFLWHLLLWETLWTGVKSYSKAQLANSVFHLAHVWFNQPAKMKTWLLHSYLVSVGSRLSTPMSFILFKTWLENSFLVSNPQLVLSTNLPRSRRLSIAPLYFPPPQRFSSTRFAVIGFTLCFNLAMALTLQQHEFLIELLGV